MKYDSAECGRLIERVWKRQADLGSVDTEDALDMADQLAAARVEIDRLTAEAGKWYRAGADGIDSALEHGLRERDAALARVKELDAKVAAMRPVVEAAEKEIQTWPTSKMHMLAWIRSAVDAYRTRSAK